MQIEQFLLLSDVEKQKEVSANGVFLGYNEDKGNRCDIYGVFNFFVEFDDNIFKKEGIKITACLYPEDLPTIAKILQPRVMEL